MNDKKDNPAATSGDAPTDLEIDLETRLREMGDIIREGGHWDGNEFLYADKSESDIAMLDDLLTESLRLARIERAAAPAPVRPSMWEIAKPAPATASGDLPHYGRDDDFFSLAQVQALSESIKPGDGWGGEDWDFALANAAADFVERKYRAAVSAATKPTEYANKDVEWLMQCAEEAQAHPEVASKIRAATKRVAVGAPAAWMTLDCIQLKPSSVTLDREDVSDHNPAHIVPLYTADQLRNAATKPTADLSKLTRYEWTSAGMDDSMRDPARWGDSVYVKLADVQSLLATKPAAQTVPTNDAVYEEVRRLRGVNSTMYVSTNAVNDVMQAVRSLIAAAPAATPAAQDQADRPTEIKVDGDVTLRYEKRTSGEHGWLLCTSGRLIRAMNSGEVALIEAALASRCRAQGGNTQADSAQVAPAASADAVVDANDDWQPIETAPRDGTEVMLYLGAPWNRVAKARWFSEWANWQEGTFPIDGDEYCGIGSNVPTHWMPLPTAPLSGVLRTGEGVDKC